MVSKLIAQGAEASVYQKNVNIVKQRLAKSYRFPVLDIRLRRTRTKKEIKLLQKTQKIINVPNILESSDFSIILEQIKGKKLASEFDKLKNKNEIAEKIGEAVAKLHNAGIIHGDLTTSNMIWCDNKLYLIDFGLGFESDNIEDKAVDIHVFREALTARHNKHSEALFQSFIKGYKIAKDYTLILGRLETVEKRGRYKQAY